MGPHSVAYHEANVAGRADDHAGAALAYYGSRGETPLRWGGSGAGLLGVEGEATPEASGGVRTGRHPPAAHRSRAGRDPPAGGGAGGLPAQERGRAGVIGRAEDMHAICDAERDATMAYLDAMGAPVGGRRGGRPRPRRED
ncbi:MAG: hypothetical protein NVS3B12_09450 [Acidimicrobiales bacterium]